MGEEEYPGANRRLGSLADRRRTTDQHQDVYELRVATARLTEQIGTLSVALQTVGVLQAKQIEVEKLAQEAITASSEQRDLSNTLLGQLDIMDASTVNQDELKSYRKSLVAKLTTASLLGVLLVASVLLAAANWVQGHNQAIYTVCQDRTNGAIAIHGYIDHLLAMPGPLSKQQDQIDLLRALEKATPITNCQGLR